MDEITKLSGAIVDMRTAGGRAVALRIPLPIAKRIMARVGMKQVDLAAKVLMGLPVVREPAWWPQSYIGLQNVTGRWHLVAID